MKTRILIFSSIFLVLAGCKKNDPAPAPLDPKPIELPSKSHEVIEHSNAFGIDLFKAVAEVENGNMMLSPLSASTALTMLLNGCNGETYDQIRDMLGFENLTAGEINNTYLSLVGQLLSVDPKIKLALANAVFYRDLFIVKQNFLDTMDRAFGAHIEALDFNSPSALDVINGWASDNTFGKIPEVLKEISPQAVMFLMNALYFKGEWTYEFDKSLTAENSFHLDDGSVASVEMMKGEISVRMHHGSNYSAIELPYGRQNFSMVIVVPSATLAEFLEEFGHTMWTEITSGLDQMSGGQNVEVMVPKFKFEYEKKLNEQLQALGMVDAFEPALADLSGISDADIFVSFVKQNTYVDMNEEGTEAAAVTVIGVELTGIGTPTFYVLKPFLFAIRERTTNSLLFIGKVTLPEYD